jgi:hypothetical protein
MDYDQDTNNDLLVGTPRYDTPAGDTGAVFVYLNNGTTISTTPDITINNPVGGGSRYFGSSLAKGDLDDDTFDDLIVGMPRTIGLLVEDGAAIVFFSDNNGLINTGSPQVIYGPNNVSSEAYFGSAVEVFRTVGGSTDGWDLVVGADMHRARAANGDTCESGNNRPGKVFIYHGKVNQDAGADNIDDTFDMTIPHPSEFGLCGNHYFGSAMYVGDWDRDGYDDLIIGARNLVSGGINIGGVIFYRGKSDGGFPALINGSPGKGGHYLNPEALNTDFGFSVLLHDFNHNGSDDLLVGAPDDNTYGDTTGKVRMIRGGFQN